MTFLKHILCLCLVSILATSCDPKKDDVIIVGTSADMPPYEFMQNGQLVGFDVDLMNAIGEALDKKIEFRNMEFHGLLAALSNKSIDMAISAISITKERKHRVDFSLNYTTASVALLYKRDKIIEKYEDLKSLLIAAQLGSIHSVVAHDLAKTYGCRVESYPNILMMVEEIKNGRIAGIVMEESQAKKFVEIYPFFAFMPMSEHVSAFAIALPKNSTRREEINNSINLLKNNGTIQDLARKWGISDD